MARFAGRYRRGYSRYYRRGYGGRFWRRNFWRRGVGSAQVAGNRRFTVVVPVQDAFSVSVSGASNFSNVHGVCPYSYNSNDQTLAWRYTHGSMMMSELYRVYVQLYDEVKINSVSVTFQLMSGIGIGGVVPALKFVTSWDRDCNYDECVYGTGVPNSSQMRTGSESQSVLVSNTSAQKVFRFNRATDLIEKCTFHDCTVNSSGTAVNDKMFAAGSGLNRIGYCPCCFFMINTATQPGEGQTYTFNISMEVKYNVTFRNPKYGLASPPGRSLGEGVVKEGVSSEISEETIKKLKDLLHEDVQLPLVEEDTRMSMDDGEKDEKGS